jgi:hypothetical protein
MTTITNPAELRRIGLQVLVRELGYVNAMRFLLQYETGQGDYTLQRHQVLPPWSPEEMVAQADKLASHNS